MVETDITPAAALLAQAGNPGNTEAAALLSFNTIASSSRDPGTTPAMELLNRLTTCADAGALWAITGLAVCY